jgi:heme exporter protein A
MAGVSIAPSVLAKACKKKPSMPDPALQVEDLSKRFGPRWALARLSFTVPEGGALLLTGHNGSGKTTLLKVLSTLLSPTAGRVRVFGQTLSQREKIRPLVGLLSHVNFLYEDLSARENLMLHARLLGTARANERVGELLESVGLSARAEGLVRTFSAGMRKRVALARLLLHAPRLVLLDEPFGELDPAGIAFTEALIGRLKRDGATVVLATHLVEQGRALCDARLHLEQGREARA